MLAGAEEMKLMEEAKKARERSYCPYSKFAVGAALLCEDGTVALGCNVESGSYSPSNCAERTAIFAAVAQGKRKFRAIAIAGGNQGEEAGPCYPCGVCRQVMAEFCDKDFQVVCKNEEGQIEILTLGELLPRNFSLL